MPVNIIDYIAQSDPGSHPSQKTLELGITKVMEEKRTYYDIIFSFQKLTAEYVNSFKMDVRTVSEIFFCKGYDIWIGINSDKF